MPTPLAERMRPQTLKDYLGQNQLVGPQAPLKALIEQEEISSMIFWGPPGCGKTTLARIIAQNLEADFHEISAISAGVKDIRAVIEKAKDNRSGLFQQDTLLFIDEIHRFNKAQQDALLKSVETGDIILIGATTENPSFEVISALLSRCTVYTLQAHDASSCQALLEKACVEDAFLKSHEIELQEVGALFQYAAGDARVLLNTFEKVVQYLLKQSSDGPLVLTQDVLEKVLQKHFVRYDKSGEEHYNRVSALIKSVRGSDPDAALYWLACMLEGGEDPLFLARRLIILASEDIGNAEPYALTLANACFQAVHTIGMPEARIILGQTTAYLAACPKSNAAYKAIDAALSRVRKYGADGVPLHLRNAPTGLMKDLGYGKDYKYAHQHPDHFVKERYLPESVSPDFYQPTAQGKEKILKQRLERLWPERYQ